MLPISEMFEIIQEKSARPAHRPCSYRCRHARSGVRVPHQAPLVRRSRAAGADRRYDDLDRGYQHLGHDVAGGRSCLRCRRSAPRMS